MQGPAEWRKEYKWRGLVHKEPGIGFPVFETSLTPEQEQHLHWPVSPLEGQATPALPTACLSWQAQLC